MVKKPTTISVKLTLDELARLDNALITENCSLHNKIKYQGDYYYSEWNANSELWGKIYDLRQKLKGKQSGEYQEDECPVCHVKTYTATEAHFIESMGCCPICSHDAGDC